MFSIRACCLFLLFTAFPAAFTRADQIVWGTSLSLTDVNFDSTGAPLDNSFTFALGTFGVAFDPDSSNADLWASNWKTLDTAAYNPTYDYFTSATDLADNSVFAEGEKAYIWIYNNQAAAPGSEWLLVHGLDQNAAPWAIPPAPGGRTAFPLEFRISKVTDTPFGGANGVQGAGEFTSTPTSFILQTHTFVTIPEPSTAGLLAGGLLGLLRRRRLKSCSGTIGELLSSLPPAALVPGASLHLWTVSRLAPHSLGGAFRAGPAGSAGAHHPITRANSLSLAKDYVYCWFLFCVLGIGSAVAATQDGPLNMEVITAYNFVVDSNVESPSSFSPSAAHLGVKVTNTGATTLTNVAVNIGKLVNPLTSFGTPGVFATRSVTVTGAKAYSGTFALQMPGGAPDAVRIIPSIAPGETVVQYFFVTYPLKDSAGNSVAGAAPDPSDDLWLNYDIWASAGDGATTRRVDKTNKVTMRNEISAMANKIWPNTTSKVPSQYLDAIQQSLGWRPDSANPQAGSTAQMEGIWYDLGNVGAGFDNNGDGLPDRNAWMQPVGDPSVYDPLAMRLVKCYGIVIVKLNDGTEKLMPFEDRLYFENIPANNTGAVGLVFYEFLPLASGRSATLSPYQEVASGYDNEKFNGDYGASGVTLASAPPSVVFNKTGPTVVASGGTASYALTATNSGSSSLGLPLLSLPVVFEDAVPPGLVYIAGSATATNTIPFGNAVVVSWSTDNGLTWVATEPAPASVRCVRWTMDSALASGDTATVRFQTSVPPTYPSVRIENTGVIKLGSTGSLATSTFTTQVIGINVLGDFVWRDLNRNGLQDGGAETGIADILVSLYYDANGNEILDAGEPLYATSQTNASGLYSFSNLPDAKFIAVVDITDAGLPAGFSLPDSATAAIPVSLDPTGINASAVSVLTADWPFMAALEVAKSVSPTTYGAGELITYTIDLENYAAPVAAKNSPVQTSWSTTVTGNRAAQNPASAQGAPDNAYARLDQSASADNLANSGLAFGSPTGTITKVEMVFNAYLTQQLVDDQVDVQIGGTLFSTLTTAQLNAMTGSPAVRAVDITPRNATWTWALVQALTGNLKTNKTSAGDPGVLWVDSIGFRVTTVAVPPAAGSYGPSTMDPLPLEDTYDAAKLQYVSASVAPNSVSAGTLTWNNLGPLNAGVRKTITVTFLALVPPDINANGEPDPTTVLNTATSSNAYFVSGRPTNSESGAVTVTINPRGSLGDLLWWDINANGIKEVSEPGLANVLVTLDNGAQTRTDANGYYLFTNLINGTYTVTVDTSTLPWTTFAQTRDPDATVNSASTVTINSNDGISTNDRYLDRDFGYDSASNVISGYVFRDSNGNGVQNPGEISLSGVTVTLSGTPGATVTTDSSGYYQFSSLANGTYSVSVTPPAGTTQTLDPDVTINNATTVVTSGGNLYANRNFAYMPSGALALGDTLYIDWNGNGAQDAGEAGIPNVDLFLYRDNDANGGIDPATDPLVATSVTNASGVYGFSGVPAGNYLVVVNTADPQFPANVIQIQDYDGTRDSKAVVNLTVTLATVDFGYKPRGTAGIGATVFRDTSGNGLREPSETGIANVPITLYADTNNNGVVDAADAAVATTTTATDGSYLFTGLAPGRYLVDLDQTAAAIPSDAFGNKFRLTTLDPQLVTLTSGQTYPAADFGFAAPAAIGDFVFFDANGNGTQDFSETGIPDVTVELYLDVNQDGLPDSPTPVATAVTADGSGANPAGFYQLTNLAAGAYFVKVLTSTLPHAGGQPIPLTSDPDRDGVPEGDNTYPGLPAGDHGDSLVIVPLGGNYTGADFGYKPPGSIGDFVWLDLDQDGIQDSGEPGIANVTVQVSNGTTTYTATTDFDGRWSLANLPDGAWTVSIPASNFAPAGALENTTNTYDYEGAANSSAAIVLTNGTVNPAVGNLGLDFGYKLAGSYSLAGTVITHDTGITGTADDIDDFYDDGVDHDAGPLDEIELAGIEVYLYTTAGRLLGSTFTDSKGNYLFNGLPSGDYRVIIGTTSDVLLGSTVTTTVANNPGVSLVNSSSGTSVIQTLTIGTASVTNVDFAFTDNNAYDYGDLPLSYSATTLGQDGARHIIPPGGSTLYLGGAPDADTNGIPSSLANGDDLLGSDDENGVTTVNPASWTNGATGGTVQVSVTGSGWLVGWVDWNQDGDFLDTGEMIISRAVSTGTVPISFDIPAGTIGATSESWLSRFRLFTTKPAYPLFSYTGVVTNGEVEDHLLEKPVGSSIGDLAWNDANGNGIPDSGESGIGGIVIQLRDSGNNLIGNQITSDGSVDVDGDGVIDPAGSYRFRGLSAGPHTVTVTTPPAGFIPSYDENGTGTPNVTIIALTSSEQHLTSDFGYAPLRASISGQVRYDSDSDGDFKDPDSGAAYVKIQLWSDPDGDGNPSEGVQVGETYTAANGNYIFTNVPTGQYVVVEINPSGSTSTYDVGGSLTDNRIPVVMIGTNITGRDFLDTMPPLYAISGTVYEDNDTTNDNVIGADDTSLASITVKLFFDRDVNGIVSLGDSEIGSVLTNGTGNYSFPDLTAASYVVQEIDPAGGTSEWDSAGSLTDNQIGVTLFAANIAGLNFLDDGYLGTVTGQLYIDTNGNGIQDGAEPNLAGVDVLITDSLGGTQTVATNSSGTWTASVLPGSTIANVLESDPQYPTGYSQTQGTDPTTVTAVAGVSTNGGIDGYFLSGSITGFVLADTNNDTTGDAPLTNVILTLKNSAGADIDSDPHTAGVQPTTKTTAANGGYSFTGLPPGNYRVAETQPAGYLSVSDVDGGNPDLIGDTVPITVTTGGVTAGRNFVEKAVKQSTFAAWKTWNGLSGSDGQQVPDAGGNGGNPDTDLYSNLLEYAFCFPPRSGINPGCAGEIKITAGGRIDYALTVATGLTDVTLSLETAGSLGSPTAWSVATGLVSGLTDNLNGTSTIVYEDLESLGAAYADGDGFVRVRVGLDTNADTVPDLFDDTPVSGWTDHTHAGNVPAAIPDQCTTFSMPYLKCPVISGAADGNAALSIDLTGAAGGVSVAGALNPAKRYFAEMTGGTLEGHRFEVDVSGSTPTSLALKAVSRVNTRVLTTGALTGAPVVVRELWTYRELFPPATFLPGTSGSNSDALLVHTGTAWRSYFLADLGAVRQWVLAGDPGLLDQGDEILTPGEGLFVHRRGPSLTIARNGMVRENDFASPFPGTGRTLGGSGYPLDQSYASRVMTVANGFKGDVDLSLASEVLFWAGDTQPGKMSYTTDFLLDAGGDPLRYWTSADDSFLMNLDSLPLFNGTGAAFYDMPVALPNYVVPAQWYDP